MAKKSRRQSNSSTFPGKCLLSQLLILLLGFARQKVKDSRAASRPILQSGYFVKKLPFKFHRSFNSERGKHPTVGTVKVENVWRVLRRGSLKCKSA
jgi:hypothetical protein